MVTAPARPALDTSLVIRPYADGPAAGRPQTSCGGAKRSEGIRPSTGAGDGALWVTMSSGDDHFVARSSSMSIRALN